MPDKTQLEDSINYKFRDLGDGTFARTNSIANIFTRFRDTFEEYTPNVGGKWTENKATGDLIFVDGNASAASYLVISKNPLAAGTESSITANTYFNLPVDVIVGLSMSQRVLGQEFSVEVIDNSTPLSALPELAISSISQTTTTLTVDTTTAHGLSIGTAIGIYGCSNQLVNYPSLVVASTPSPTQFTATAGPGGTITSQTVTNPTGDKGFVYFRERIGRAKNGISQIFESTTATNSSMYIRSESGDAYPSGTVAGSHSVTIATTASIALANGAYQYSWSPTTEYRYLLQPDRVQWLDAPVDGISQATTRLTRTQICPDPNKNYTIRVRTTNNKGLTIPGAQILSATKTASATATVITATAHGLTTGDLVVIYGTRDQTNFANITTATAVTVVDSVTFTLTWGSSATATTYGGFIAKPNGGVGVQGVVSQVIQSATLSTLSNGVRQLVLVGSGTWAGVAIGDLVNVIGCRNNVDGTTLGIDGAWKVANTATTTLTLVLPFAGSMSVPSDFASADCGGGVVRRTDIRISYIRTFDYDRARVELLPRGAGDASIAAPVVVQGGQNLSTTAGGPVAHDTAVSGNPVRVGGRGVSAAYTTVTTGDTTDLITTLQGVLVTRPWQIPELEWSYAAAGSGIVNTTTAVTIRAAAGTGLRSYITGIQVSSDTLTNATELAIRDGAGGTVLWRIKIPTTGLGPCSFTFENPLRSTANTLLEVVTLTASGAGAVYFNAQGFTGA